MTFNKVSGFSVLEVRSVPELLTANMVARGRIMGRRERRFFFERYTIWFSPMFLFSPRNMLVHLLLRLICASVILVVLVAGVKMHVACTGIALGSVLVLTLAPIESIQVKKAELFYMR